MAYATDMVSLSKFASPILATIISFCAAPILAQDPPRTGTPLSASSSEAQKRDEDIVQVNTRAVFFDVLVKDKRTGLPVKDLTRADFLVFDNGRPRTLTYFSREGEKRRPLALVLVIDAWPVPDEWLANGAAVMEHFAKSLGRLMPEDEVAVVLTEFGEADFPCQPTSMGGVQVKPLQVLQGLTRDRASAANALRAIPLSARHLYDARRELHSKTRQLDDYRPSGILCVRDVIHQMALDRPGADVGVLIISDDLNVFTPAQRESIIEALMRSGVSVHGLLTKISFPFSINFGMVNFRGAEKMPAGSRAWFVQDLAKETGGESIRVGSPDEYVKAFEMMIDGLAARYSLGFSLGENEPNDGRVHRLDVQVSARDASGKERKLVASARRRYYLSRTKV
jgi:VWFA-related protein